MKNIEGQRFPEEIKNGTKSEAEVSADESSLSITFRKLNLDKDNPYSPEVNFVVEKKPVELREGVSYFDGSVLIDKKNELMKSLSSEARSFSDLPERERLAKVLEIFRHQMGFPYEDIMKRLSETNLDLAKWIDKNTGVNCTPFPNVPLSQLLENKYGVCSFLSVGYLWLAQEAGLKGVILKSGKGVLRNIRRSDTKKKLFKSAEVGDHVPSHAWVEINTSDGSWIPVDPTANLIGNTKEGLKMFQEANYLADGNIGLNFEEEPRGIIRFLMKNSVIFAPAESRVRGLGCLELISTKPRYGVGSGILPPTNTPYSGKGRLIIKADKPFTGIGLDIIEVSTGEKNN